MAEIFSVALASMQQDLARLDRVASNVANVSTPGYRREVLAARPFGDALVAAAGSAAAGRSPAPEWAEAGALAVYTDPRPGTIKATAQPLDLALTDDGFFEVLTEAGPAYTRQGTFHLDARGRLVTAQGYPVMGLSGEIQLSTRAPVVDELGVFRDPDAPVTPGGAPAPSLGQLKIVRFEDARTMPRLGDGLFGAGARMTVLADGASRVRQGAVESSNVSTMSEMVQLIQTMRHFESIQKVVQGYDELLGLSVRKLGDLA